MCFNFPFRKCNEITEEAIANKEAENALKHVECLICDFSSNWENGLKIHMSRKHSKIEQIDGHFDHPEDEKYVVLIITGLRVVLRQFYKAISI